MTVQIQIRRGTAAEWTAADPVLAEGELGVELDTDKFKIGNGVDDWGTLSYATGPAGPTGAGVPTGGTTNQVLAKLSATNYDTAWVTPAAAAVDSVNGQTGVIVLDAADVGAEPADATILKDADIGVTVQGYSAVLAGTTASFTTADETKLDSIEAGAEVNVNADWNAVSGDAQILNKPSLATVATTGAYADLTGKPTLGTAAATASTDYATAAQGALADSAVQPAAIANMLETSDIGVTVQGYSADLAGTTASFTTADETKLDGIAAGAEVNVNADWNAVSGDAQILNKPTLGTAAAAATTDFATAAQGTKADSALQAADIGVTVQGYSSVLAGTTASFTTADETKLDGIEAGAEVNVNADWNAGSGDAQILNKPAILAFSGGIATIAIVSSLPGSPDANTLYVVV